MKRNLPVRIFSILISAALVLILPAGSFNVRAEESTQSPYTTIEISSIRDLIELSENCHDESWSVDKYVVLTDDISLAGSEFTYIPIFSGFFNGNGHTISGYTYGGTGYVTGLFRYVGKTATIERLTVSGDIVSEGDGYVNGLIAGINEGCIRVCNAGGVLSGKTATGAIAGINGECGLISNCRNSADVTGFYYTGGIAGRNYGTIRDCVNAGGIDSTPEWVAANDERQVDIISEITGDVSLISYQSGVDIGGIAGYSHGIIMSCRNDATVGYSRVGYNVGGICGRQSGVLYSCLNYGKVFGKKDIGGICGQQEPYIETDKSKSVSDAIARINELSRKAADDASGMTPDIQDALAALQAASGRAMDDADAMTGDYSRYKIEERDWAGMIEDQAENAGRSAAQSVRDSYSEYIGDLDSYSDEDLADLIESLEGRVPDKPDEELTDAEREAREAREKAEADAEKEKEEAAAELNGNINGEISRWNSGIDTLSANTELITSDLQDVRKATDSLLAVSNAYSTLLTYDLTAVSDQINATYDLIDDLITGVEDEGVSYLFSDVSEMDLPDALYGRSVSCRNYGSVNGDINTGGIAGCLAVDTENLESNVIRKFDLKTGEAYAISGVIYDCENSGIVRVRTTCGGGIAGDLEHGCIRSCRGYGAVLSDEGEYIGGIAGSSEGSIVSSYVLCTLSGKENIGGVAGYASGIKYCISMPVFGNVGGVCGGIAGKVSRDPDTESIDDTDFVSNYYVSDDYYGIDDISYAGIADRIGYEDVLDIEGIPSEFFNLKVTFVSDGDVIGEYRLAYGESVAELDLPEIPDKDGSYGVWPDLTDVTVKGDLVIEAGFVSHVAVIRSERSVESTEKPLALIQGEFKTTDTLDAELSNEKFEAPDNSAYTEVTVYSVRFSGRDGSLPEDHDCMLRLYAPYEECRVWKKAGDIWMEVPCTVEGSYVQIKMDSSAGIYAVTKTPDETLKHIGYAAIGLIGFVIAAVLIRQIVRSGKKRKKRS